jgi:histidine triad (HIT) family protein
MGTVLMRPRDNACIFCAMVAGTVPCHAVYEDEHLLAFVDHRPLNPGHVLVVPKRHEADFHRLASDLYGALMQLAQRLGKCLAHLYQPPKVGLFVIGFHVPHVHVHVVPLYTMADMTAEAFERTQRTAPAAAGLVDSSAQIRQALAVMAANDPPAGMNESG